MKQRSAISPKRCEDYPQWYQQVIKAADLAENSPVRGCMVIKPWGYGIWENIQKNLDKKIKETGCQNAYFPLFIPLSFMEKEAQHVKGFAKECAIVTHHRLEKKEDKLVPEGELEEPLVVRPTSEMMIGEMFSRWIESYRDLPLMINQWANIVRWEMRTRMFLRTTEFLWQEGHTAHSNEKEALEKTQDMLDLYSSFLQEYLAIPVIKGRKTATERFPGAVETYSVEAMMQDKKALQAGTSHFLGQNFSRSSQIKFRDKNGKEVFAWTTSWGVATRLIGGIIMMHSDDDGLILPPAIANLHVVILPVIHSENFKRKVLSFCREIKEKLQEKISIWGTKIECFIDERDMRGGEKKWQWIKKGVPILLEIGPRDCDNQSVSLKRRDDIANENIQIKVEEFVSSCSKWLEEMQKNLFNRALSFREDNIVPIDKKEDFYAFFTPENKDRPEIHGGFALSHFCGDEKIEKKIKEELNVSVRCIPIDGEKDEGTCIFTNKKSLQRMIFAKAY